MSQNIWQQLKKPLYIQAPMDGITDSAFRKILAKCGKPDLFFTEFVSAEGLASKGRKNLLPILKYDKSEKPIIAQLFGKDPEAFKSAAKTIVDLGFDGIDINMGCPDRRIFSHGSGSALINNPKLAIDIINSTIESSGGLAVSVKTRIGITKNEVDTWIPKLLRTKVSALTIHARTRNQMYGGIADWSIIKKAVEMRNKLNPDILIIGNGDITSLDDADKKIKETGVDGVMIARAMIGNPWIFNREVTKAKLTQKEILSIMLEHCRIFEKTSHDPTNFLVMRKHMKEYIKGFENSKELKIALMTSNCYSDVEHAVNKFLKSTNAG